MSAPSNIAKLPTQQEMEQAQSTSRILSKYAQCDRMTLKLPEGEDLILPGYALELLLDILTEVSKGNAITLMPIHAELTTQEAANLLNVSRPYLITLLEQGDIPYRKVGTHRRIMASDLLNYHQTVTAQRHAALDELVAHGQAHDMGYD